mgnify:FL=1|tara:strand:+ start:180 stop:707 length:528 start_codon:yes stop_codon:yes gene_type:complete
MKKLIIISLVLSSLFNSLIASTIATVDVQRVLSEYVEFNQAVEKVRSSVAPIEEEIQRMQEEITSIIADAREADSTANNPALDDKARDEARSKLVGLQSKLQNKQSQLQQFSQQAQDLAQNGQSAELAPLQDKALAAVEKVSKADKIDLVLPKNSVVFSADSLDISDKVIAELNK